MTQIPKPADVTGPTLDGFRSPAQREAAIEAFVNLVVAAVLEARAERAAAATAGMARKSDPKVIQTAAALDQAKIRRRRKPRCNKQLDRARV